MNAQILVLQATAVPSPNEFAGYLLQQGWAIKERASADGWAIYSKSHDGETVSLEVPQRAAAPDYGRAVGMLVEDLARLEERPITSVLRDVRSSSLDVVRIAIDGSSTRDGRISVEAGMRVYEAARDLMLAAACSVLSPRPVFAKRKPAEAMTILDKARFGQSEVGSFVLTIECTIPPRLQLPLHDNEADIDPEPPLERRTCIQLARALHAAEAATRESGASLDIEPFRRRTKEGVSANLCEAIATMIDATAADVLRTSFTFASRRKVVGEVPRVVVWSSDTAEILRSAALGLRDEASYPAAEVVGSVVQLDSQNLSEGGEATLRVDLDGRMRRVKVRLDPSAYQLAINAHRDGSLVQCSGDLKREGRSWTLHFPREFAVCLEQE